MAVHGYPGGANLANVLYMPSRKPKLMRKDLEFAELLPGQECVLETQPQQKAVPSWVRTFPPSCVQVAGPPPPIPQRKIWRQLFTRSQVLGKCVALDGNLCGALSLFALCDAKNRIQGVKLAGQGQSTELHFQLVGLFFVFCFLSK